ncbi:MAG TPA: hypothetical protein ENI23_14475 [bacterium]|nr:hypothetical protein [bacterium]
MTKEDIVETRAAIDDVGAEIIKIRRIKRQMKIYQKSHPQNPDALTLAQGMEIQYKQLLKAEMVLRAHLEDLIKQ